MKIGILQCGKVEDKFSDEHGQYPDMFIRLLHQVQSNLTFTTYCAEEDKLPRHLNEADAYLITGSRHCVNDDFSWISQLENLIRQFHTARKKMIGICFGHQLIAKALGGQVSPSPE